MRNFGYTINVNKDSNVIIGHSDVDWSALRDNSLINIDDDEHFYTVGNKEEVFFIQDFVNIGNNSIEIQGNHEYFFLADDTLTITYKEYELLTVKTILDKGSSYKHGDIISLSGGILSVNNIDNSSKASIFKVEEVDSSGGINKLSIINKGIYIEFPNLDNDIKGGTGNGAKVSVLDKTIDTRKTIERQVASVKNTEHSTIITLNYLLPSVIKSGKISCKKWKAYLTSWYANNNKRNVDYHINFSVTPKLGMPLVIKGSNKHEECFNKSLLMLDAEISRLQKEIELLKNK